MWTWCTPRYSVLMVVSAKITVFWDVTWHTFMDRCKHFGEACYLSVQGTHCTIHYEDGSSSFVHRICIHLQNCTLSQKNWGSHSIDVETGRSSRSYHPLKVMTLPSSEVSGYLLHGVTSQEIIIIQGNTSQNTTTTQKSCWCLGWLWWLNTYINVTFAQRRATLLLVSSPPSVVRSMQVIARRSQAACHSFLTERRDCSTVARRLTAGRFIWTLFNQPRSEILFLIMWKIAVAICHQMWSSHS